MMNMGLINNGLNQRIAHVDERISFWKGNKETQQVWKGIRQELLELKKDIETQITDASRELKRIERSRAFQARCSVTPGSGVWSAQKSYISALQLVVYGE